MANLPQKQTLEQLQPKWASILDPLIKNPSNNANILPNISLTTGSNTINHKLGANLQGWSIIRQRASATVYDTQDSNQTPNLTLTLTASANVVVDLLVF